MQDIKPIRVFVPGKPIAQPRNPPTVLLPRIAQFADWYDEKYRDANAVWHWFRRNARGRSQGIPKTHAVNAWRTAICLALRQQEIPSAFSQLPIQFDFAFVLPRPKNEFRKTKPNPRYFAAKKPDWDNLCKAVADAITNVYADDSHIAHTDIRKFVASGDDEPGVALRIGLANDIYLRGRFDDLIPQKRHETFF